jgi:hypothetical protein
MQIVKQPVSQDSQTVYYRTLKCGSSLRSILALRDAVQITYAF